LLEESSGLKVSVGSVLRVAHARKKATAKCDVWGHGDLGYAINFDLVADVCSYLILIIPCSNLHFVLICLFRGVTESRLKLNVDKTVSYYWHWQREVK